MFVENLTNNDYEYDPFYKKKEQLKKKKIYAACNSAISIILLETISK